MCDASYIDPDLYSLRIVAVLPSACLVLVVEIQPQMLTPQYRIMTKVCTAFPSMHMIQLDASIHWQQLECWITSWVRTVSKKHWPLNTSEGLHTPGKTCPFIKDLMGLDHVQRKYAEKRWNLLLTVKKLITNSMLRHKADSIPKAWLVRETADKTDHTTLGWTTVWDN